MYHSTLTTKGTRRAPATRAPFGPRQVVSRGFPPSSQAELSRPLRAPPVAGAVEPRARANPTDATRPLGTPRCPPARILVRVRLHPHDASATKVRTPQGEGGIARTVAVCRCLLTQLRP